MPQRAMVIIVSGLMGLMGTASLASAQGRPSRPYLGVFGGGLGETEQSLIATLGVSGGRDSATTDAPAGAGLSGLPAASGPTSFGGWSGNLAYGLSRPRVSLDASAAVYSRYLQQTGKTVPLARSGSAGFHWQVFRHTDVSVSADTTHQPVSVLSLFPGLPAGGVSQSTLGNYTLGDQPLVYVSNQGQFDITQQVSRRSSFFVSAGTQRSTFGLTGSDERTIQTASAGYTHQLSRSVALRLGYQESVGTYTLAQSGERRRFANHSVDAGINYSGSLSLSRRTTLAIETGTALISDRILNRFWVSGSAVLHHEMGRTWDLALAYDRQAGFVESLSEPTFTDSVTTRLGGLLGRRVQVQSSFGVSAGDIGLSRTNNGYTAYHGGAGLSTSFSRFVNLRIDYTYYRYASMSSELLPLGLSRFSDHSVSAGVDVWAPLFSRVRRGNASR